MLGVLSFQLLSILGKGDCKVKIFFIEELKIFQLHFDTVYAPIYF